MNAFSSNENETDGENPYSVLNNNELANMVKSWIDGGDEPPDSREILNAVWSRLLKEEGIEDAVSEVVNKKPIVEAETTVVRERLQARQTVSELFLEHMSEKMEKVKRIQLPHFGSSFSGKMFSEETGVTGDFIFLSDNNWVSTSIGMGNVVSTGVGISLYSSAPGARDLELFSRTVDEKGQLPPRMLAIVNNNNPDRGVLRVADVQHVSESSLAKYRGVKIKPDDADRVDFNITLLSARYEDVKHPETKNYVTELVADNLPWMIALAQHKELNKMMLYPGDMPKNNIKIEDLGLTNLDVDQFDIDEFRVESEVFANNDKFARLLAASLLKVNNLESKSTPIIIEQNWSLSEKAFFVHMLQEFSNKKSKNNDSPVKLINWTSESNVSLNSNNFQVVFASIGEVKKFVPEANQWNKYIVVSENGYYDNELDDKVVELSGKIAEFFELEINWKKLVDEVMKDWDVESDLL